MIQRFEEEFPNCRLANREPSPSTSNPVSDDERSPSPSPTDPYIHATTNFDTIDDDQSTSIRTPLMRHGSDVSLASRSLGLEEGRMHRIGQHVRREILRPQSLDFLHGTTGEETEGPAFRELRTHLEGLEGPLLRDCLEKMGPEELVRRFGGGEEQLKRLRTEDPVGFEHFLESQEKALANMGLGRDGLKERDLELSKTDSAHGSYEEDTPKEV